MKKKWILIIFLFPVAVFSQLTVQWNDNFSDGDFTNNPTWTGTTENFIINGDYQLQSKASTTSKSYLSTPSETFDDAEWEFWIKINYNPSASNYSVVYIISDRADVSGDVNGYYVQIGNSADEISLYSQQGSNRSKIIDGADRVVDVNPVIVKIKVTRTKEGIFSLYRQRLSPPPGISDNEYVLEGTSEPNTETTSSRYFGLLFSNTTTTGSAYFFDDIKVKGDRVLDVTPPVWTNLRIVEPNQMVLTFSEAVNISSALFQVDNGIGYPVSTGLSSDQTVVTLTFTQQFEKRKIYTIEVQDIMDIAGNSMENTSMRTGVAEEAEIGDLVINEILFDNPDFAPEYLEVYNASTKTLDLSQVFFATRGTNGQFSTNNKFPSNAILLPYSHLAITSNASQVRTGYSAPDTANILSSERWSALNNTAANLLIGTVTNQADTLVWDEVRYDVKWHHSLIRNTKGISLERINPAMPSQSADSWHSAASEANYGTPGYRNSQFREITADVTTANNNIFFPDPEAFTPDNDGIDDVCFIRYKTETAGFTANVIIFNAVGVKVTQLASNMLLGSEGYLIWDGKTDRGVNVNPGIYVLYIELVNAGSGVKKIEKMPIVVSAR